MTCEETRRLLDAYLDGELDLLHNLEIEGHLSTCTECSIRYRNRQILRDGLSHEQLYYNAPPALAARIHRSLAQDEPSRIIRFPRWLLLAAALLVIGFALGALWRSPAIESQPIVGQVIASHLRSLMVNHLEDVVSTDQHTVKPWFDGKLDFAPPVLDFSADGFPLLGGRLDYVDNRAVAALVFQRYKHVINLFIWPSSEGESPQSGVQQGIHYLHWTADGMTFWAISDVSESDLQTFTHLYQAGATPSPEPR
jgi:anti-sigma factor RsiW